MLCRPVWSSATEGAAYLLENNFTYFFDINATADNAKWFRSAVLFYETNVDGENVWENGYALPLPWDSVGSITQGTQQSNSTRNPHS